MHAHPELRLSAKWAVLQLATDFSARDTSSCLESPAHWQAALAATSSGNLKSHWHWQWQLHESEPWVPARYLGGQAPSSDSDTASALRCQPASECQCGSRNHELGKVMGSLPVEASLQLELVTDSSAPPSRETQAGLEIQVPAGPPPGPPQPDSEVSSPGITQADSDNPGGVRTGNLKAPRRAALAVASTHAGPAGGKLSSQLHHDESEPCQWVPAGYRDYLGGQLEAPGPSSLTEGANTGTGSAPLQVRTGSASASASGSTTTHELGMMGALPVPVEASLAVYHRYFNLSQPIDIVRPKWHSL
jgi:hypothetical protein